MKLLEFLATARSSAQMSEFGKRVLRSPKLLKELILVFTSANSRISWRAGNLLYTIARHDPECLKSHIKSLIRNLRKTDSPAVRRLTMRLLSVISIPSFLHARVIEAAHRYVQDHAQPIAVKVFSMTVLYNLSSTYPELRNEIRIIVEDLLRYSGPAIRSRGSKILSALAHDDRSAR